VPQVNDSVALFPGLYVALIQGLPWFVLRWVCAQFNPRKRNSSEKQERHAWEHLLHE